jgi:hypothetical protein
MPSFSGGSPKWGRGTGLPIAAMLGEAPPQHGTGFLERFSSERWSKLRARPGDRSRAEAYQLPTTPTAIKGSLTRVDPFV